MTEWIKFDKMDHRTWPDIGQAVLVEFYGIGHDQEQWAAQFRVSGRSMVFQTMAGYVKLHQVIQWQGVGPD